jgi:hypothetical protein
MLLEQSPDDRFSREVTVTGKSGIEVTLKVPSAVANVIERHEAALKSDSDICERFSRLYREHGKIAVLYGDENNRDGLFEKPMDRTTEAILWLVGEVITPTQFSSYSSRDLGYVSSVSGGALKLLVETEDGITPSVSNASAFLSYVLLRILVQQPPQMTEPQLSQVGIVRSILSSVLQRGYVLGTYHDDSSGTVFGEMQRHLFLVAQSTPEMKGVISKFLSLSDGILEGEESVPEETLSGLAEAKLPSLKSDIWPDSVASFHEPLAYAMDPAGDSTALEEWLHPIDACLKVIRENKKERVILDERLCDLAPLFGARSEIDLSPLFKLEMALLKEITGSDGRSWDVEDTFHRYRPLVFADNFSVMQDRNRIGAPRSLVDVHGRIKEFLSNSRSLGEGGFRELFGLGERTDLEGNIDTVVKWWVMLDEARRSCGASITLHAPIHGVPPSEGIGDVRPSGAPPPVSLSHIVGVGDETATIFSLIPAGKQCAPGCSLGDIFGYSAYMLGTRNGWGDLSSAAVRYRGNQRLIALNHEMAEREMRERKIPTWPKDLERTPSPLFTGALRQFDVSRLLIFTNVPSTDDGDDRARTRRPAPGVGLTV